MTWLKIGLLGFGGPAGQIALMHRLVVDEKRWLDDARFLHALNYCMLLPGPEAQQLAIYIGWLLHGLRGGLVAGILFVLPGALIVLGFAIAYASFADLPLMQGLFLGIKAGVLALVVEAFIRVARRILKDRFAIALAAAAFVALFVFAVPFPYVIIGAVLLGSMRKAQADPQADAPPVEAARRHWLASLGTLASGLLVWLAPVALLWFGLGARHILTQLAVFFAQLAVVTFGGAYAILAYVAQHVVEVQGWLTPGEMLDGLGLAETTPGPLILVLEFVGFIAAYKAPGSSDPYLMGALGASIVVWVTFAPCFLWIFLGAPYVEGLRSHARLNQILSAITSAVAGVILNLSLWFAIHALFGSVRSFEGHGLHLSWPQMSSLDWRMAGIAAAAFVTLFLLRWGTLGTLAVASLLGILAAQFLR